MLTITGDRGSGKTTALVAVFKTDPLGVLVLPNRAMRENVFRKWPETRMLRTASAENLDRALEGLPMGTRLYVDEIGLVELSPRARHFVVAATC